MRRDVSMAKETTLIKKGISNFKIVGKVIKNDYTFDLDKQSQKSDYIYSQMRLNVKTKHGNISCQAMGGHSPSKPNTIYCFGKDENGKMDTKNRFQVAFEDRLDEDIIAKVADMNLFTAGLERDENGKTIYKKFLHQEDFIKYISETLENDMVVTVRGNIEYGSYNGERQIRKNVTSIILAKEDVTEEDYEATFTQTVLTAKGFLGKPDAERGIVPLDLYIVDYIREFEGKKIIKMVNGNERETGVMFPALQTIDFKLYKDIETTKKLLRAFNPSKKNMVTEIVVDGIFTKGEVLETETVSIDDLPDDIKFMIEIGAMKEEEAVGKMSFSGGNKLPETMLITRPSVKKTEGGGLGFNVVDGKYTEDDLLIENILEANEVKLKIEEQEEEFGFEEEENEEEEDDIFGDDDWAF